MAVVMQCKYLQQRGTLYYSKEARLIAVRHRMSLYHRNIALVIAAARMRILLHQLRSEILLVVSYYTWQGPVGRDFLRRLMKADEGCQRPKLVLQLQYWFSTGVL